MKKIRLIRALACCIFGVCLMLMDGCTKQSTTPTTLLCSITGTTVNIGTSAGGDYYAIVGIVPDGSNSGSNSELIYFDNRSLNFFVNTSLYYSPYSGDGTILDVGQQSCLDFSYTGTPIAASVAFKNGEGYVGKFIDGHIVKFIALGYNSGVASITYVLQ
jgi:hypothetical protein